MSSVDAHDRPSCPRPTRPAWIACCRRAGATIARSRDAWRGSWSDVRRAATRRSASTQSGSTAASARSRSTADEIAAGADRAPAAVRSAIKRAARHIATVARAQVPRGCGITGCAGRHGRAARHSARSRGLLRARRPPPLPSSLLMTAIPARVAGVREVIAVCPRPDESVLAAAQAAGVTRLFRVGGAHAIAALAYRDRDDPACGQNRRARQPVGRGRESATSRTNARSTSRQDRARSSFCPNAGGPTGLPPISSRRRSTTRTRGPCSSPRRADLAKAVADAVTAQMPADGPARASLAAHGGIIVSATPGEAIALANRMAPEHLVVDTEQQAAGVRCAGSIFIGAHTRTGGWRLCDRVESRPANGCRRTISRRAERRRLRARRIGPADDRCGTARHRARQS